jgi:tetratricopeptide (TPR) repeat protein
VLVCAAAFCCAALACRSDRSGGVNTNREQAYRANNRGVAALEQFDYPAAANAFQEALRIDPDLALARVNLSLAFLYSQDLQGAAREAAEAARLLPDAPQPPYILGLIARAENRTDDAVREFTRVRQIDPADVGTRINLGQILLEQRRFGEAAEMLRGAAEAEPVNVTAAYNLGLALMRGGQTEDGQRALDRAQSLRSTGYSITYGTGYLEQGRYAEGLASTGAEADLVARGTPSTRFVPAAVPPPAGGAGTLTSPIGRVFAAADLTPATARQIAAGLGGCATLLDADADEDLDLFVASGAQQRLFHNDGKGTLSDVTSAAGLGTAPDGEPVGCLAGDYDNDGRADLFVLRYGTNSLYRNEGGRFSDVAAVSGLTPYPYLPGAAAMADVDHDGDLDVIIAGLADLTAARSAAGSSLTFPRDFPPAPVRLHRNNGNGTFTDHTAAARLQAATRAVAIVPTDFDNRRDVDLLIVNGTGGPTLFKNLRDGTFQDVAREVGLFDAAGVQEIAAVAAADVNKDEFTDFFFARPSGGVFALSDGRGRFTAAPAPDAVRDATAAQLVDFDSDGLFDLLTWSSAGIRLLRNVGAGWDDVSAAVFDSSPSATMRGSARAAALGDLNGDARTDLVSAAGPAVTTWLASGATDNRGLRIPLRGRVSNRMGIGSKVQVRAGSLSVRVEPIAATPAVAPADVVVGLGPRPGADAVRVLWPSGILQAEVRDVIPSPFPIQELDRKPSSCPFLFTWNGERFEFVTDFLGAGEMGYWHAPNVRNTPDPVEYVRIAPHQLRHKDGRYELRITNELEETLYLDRLQLVSVDHPETVSLYPDEGMTSVPKPFRLIAVSAERTPRATDDRGRDQTAQIAQLDRRYADGFALERLRGYAAPHALTLDLASAAPLPAAPVLLLTAWTDYAFSSDNVAAEQAGLTLVPPRLEVREPNGRWRTVLDEIGIPVGRPQTVTVDLRGRLRAGEHEVRIVTSMRIYWDQIRLADAVNRSAAAFAAALEPLGFVSATLRERGFSAEVRPEGREPLTYDFHRVDPRSPWKSMVGRFTRVGDVRPLLTAADDMFVIAKPGDEIAVAFAAESETLPAGWTRTFLLIADGYSKEMDVNSASPDTVEPLPFHRMSGYPYQPSERYPDSREYEQYRSTYNTRVVTKAIPSIDSLPLR